MADPAKKTYQNKPVYKTLTVTLDNGSSVQVARVAVSELDTLLELQDRLLQKYVEANGMLGTMIANEDVRSQLSSMCGMLPIVGKSSSGEPQYLQFTDIQDNWEQLVTLFFNGSFDEEEREFTDVTPSKISRLHFFPFQTLFNKYLEEKREQESKKKSD
ncbi:hypothetical protein [Chroococcidiopsis sp.]|uniref:hypothetical protein n=1 Tax=Chroococcidiopsis sp. TaxID=3088168 RepID=UPI003F2CF70C